MKKLFKNILALFFPIKGFRNAVRHDFIKHYFEISKEYKKNGDNYNFENYLSIVVMAKNEGEYFAEWLEFHRLVGVDKIYIFDNESSDNSKKVLESYIKEGFVEYYFREGKKLQVPIFREMIEKLKFKTRWIAFIDLDEFLIPVKEKNLKDFLKDFENEAGIGVNWLTYGDSGHKTKTDGLVIERFKEHSTEKFEDNYQVKVILNPRMVTQMFVHHAYFIGNKTLVNSNKKKIYGWSSKPDYSKIRLNHYWGKSWEEFEKIKKRRGDAASGDKIENKEAFERHNHNEIKDDNIMLKYIEPIKKKINNK